MKCPLHRNVEMAEKRERVPFAHMPSTDEESVRRVWRTVCHCPVPGCIQVGLITTDYLPVKKKISLDYTHV